MVEESQTEKQFKKFKILRMRIFHCSACHREVWVDPFDQSEPYFCVHCGKMLSSPFNFVKDLLIQTKTERKPKLKKLSKEAVSSLSSGIGA